MAARLLLFLVPALTLFAAACSDPPEDEPEIPDRGAFFDDVPLADASGTGPPPLTDMAVGAPMGDAGPGGGPPPPSDAPYCSEDAREVCNDFDDNCDGRVDEGCNCRLPEKPCYPGDPDDLTPEGTACRAGTQACRLEFYGDCEGFVLPSDEECDGIDNDCDGATDEIEDCATVPPRAICPPDQTGPPLAEYGFQGGYEDPDGQPMARATWRIQSKPGGSTATPMPADGLNTRIFADLQGEYVLELEVEDADGGLGRCTTRLTTQTNDGLRIEMVWNVNARGDTSDVDMHLLRAPGAQWFEDGGRGDDCFFRNCRVCDSYDEAACRQQLADLNRNGSPPPQVLWSAPLNGDDPRLDLDDVDGYGPENINILDPSPGTYRLGVHYWDDEGFGASTVTVKIFCGGELAMAFDPLVMQATGRDGNASTEFWEVADIVWAAGGCQVMPLGTPDCPRICSAGTAELQGCPEGQSRGRACR
ncbi:MAG: hypothetical protein KC620_02455 [Myxococcales bacterium]|nr:hypothetical protein [Myxococcales bacterium]